MSTFRSVTMSLPRDVLSRLNSTDIQTLDIIADMCLRQGKKSPSGACYAFPGQAWLSHRMIRARETVNRSIGKLRGLGLIEVIRRRQWRGHWQTNLYKLGHQFLYSVNRCKEALNALLHRVTSSSHIVSNSHIINKYNSPKSDFSYNNKSPGWVEIADRLAHKMGFTDSQGEK